MLSNSLKEFGVKDMSSVTFDMTGQLQKAMQTTITALFDNQLKPDQHLPIEDPPTVQLKLNSKYLFHLKLEGEEDGEKIYLQDLD